MRDGLGIAAGCERRQTKELLSLLPFDRFCRQSIEDPRECFDGSDRLVTVKVATRLGQCRCGVRPFGERQDLIRANIRPHLFFPVRPPNLDAIDFRRTAQAEVESQIVL